MSEQKSIFWTPEKLAHFRKARLDAIEAGKDVFTFEGHDFLADYAYYLISFLQGEFERQFEQKKGQKNDEKTKS